MTTAPLDPAPTRTAGLPQLLLLLAASSMSVLGTVLIAPVLPSMAREFAGVPGVEVLVPIVLTVPALMIGLTAPFAGQIVDRLGRIRLLVVAMVAYSVFGTAPLYLDDLGAIIASRVLVGLCEAAIMTAATTLIGDYWSGRQRARYLGLQATVAALSATVFIAAGGLLGASGWRTPFWLYLIAAVLALPIARLLWAPAPATAADRARGLDPLPWRSLAAPLTVTFVGGLVFYALIVELSYVLTAVGLASPASIGLIAAGMSVATALGGALFGRLSALGLRTLLPLEFAISGVGLLTVFATSSVPVITVGAVITGFGTGLLLPTLLTWTLEELPFGVRGRGTGMFTGVLFIGQFLTPLVLAAVAAGVGGLQPALAVLGAAAVVVAGTLVATLRSRPVAAPTATADPAVA